MWTHTGREFTPRDAPSTSAATKDADGTTFSALRHDGKAYYSLTAAECTAADGTPPKLGDRTGEIALGDRIGQARAPNRAEEQKKAAKETLVAGYLRAALLCTVTPSSKL